MKARGFTLIELMVVVAIIVILSVISVPQYFKYVAKARQAEVAAHLASLHTAQQVFFAEHGYYTSVLWGEGGLGWRPDGYRGDPAHEQFYYTYGFNVPGAQEGVHYFTGKLRTPKESLGDSYAEQEGFVAKAAGNLQKNSVDLWSVNEHRAIEHVKDGLR